MTVVSEPIAEIAPRKRRFGVTPAVELGVIALAIAFAAITYFTSPGRAARSGC